jgi:anti-sigma factor RsiW
MVLDESRGRLAPEASAALKEHLAGCEACRRHAESERALSEVLENRLPRYAAPPALRRRLAVQWSGSPLRARGSRPRGQWVAAFSSLAAALAVVVAGATALLVQRHAERVQLQEETVNDHLRVLGGAPLAQVTGGLHEVKPWFGGKLDFAPTVRFAGDDEFPLQGGAVEAFLDRRAAVFVFTRRLHHASLFVLRPEGLGFPLSVRTAAVRGFNVILWRANDQGYALVSDLNLPELMDLQARIAATD